MATGMKPPPGSKWRNIATGEIVEVDSFDGDYAVVCGEHPEVGRGNTHSGKPNAFLVQAGCFGGTYLPHDDSPT